MGGRAGLSWCLCAGLGRLMHAQPRHSAGNPAVGVVTLMPFVLPGQRSRQLAKSKGLRRDAAAGRGQGAPMGCENADAQGASSYGAHVEGQRIKKPEEEHHPSCSLAATGEGEGAYGGAEDGGAAPEAADAPMSANATSEPPMAR